MVDYDWLDNPAERAFLTTVDPAEVVANAHRAYDWLTERGVAADSVLREAAFDKAADALGIDYDVLYRAWMDQRPVKTPRVLTADHGHVLLDAITALTARIDKGETPWEDYDDGGEDDPKVTREGYLRLLQESRAALGDSLGRRADTVLRVG